MCRCFGDQSNFFEDRFRNLRIQLSLCDTDFFNQILGLNNFRQQSKRHNSTNKKDDANPDVEVIAETDVVGYSIESWKMFDHRGSRRNKKMPYLQRCGPYLQHIALRLVYLEEEQRRPTRIPTRE